MTNYDKVHDEFAKMMGASDKSIKRTQSNRAMNRKVNAGTGRKLSKKEQSFKTKNWPKANALKKFKS